MGASVLLAALALAGNYAVQPPKWPGFLKGTVKVSGEVAALPPLAVDKDAATCGKEVPSDEVVLGQGGALSGALVFIEDIQAGRELPRRQVAMELRGCRAAPPLQSATVGDEWSVGNSDQGFHQVRLVVAGVDGKPRTQQNLGIPAGAGRIKQKAAQPGWIGVLGGGLHPWMRGATRVFEHPYHGVTGSDGTFDLKEVPPGNYVVHVWHPRFGDIARPVEVRAGWVARVDVEFPAANLTPQSQLPLTHATVP
ncbi:MAG: carboxypeptidase regulatory-like domain-containing protein [Deltaproteobacteria bacterium]|nr:carboxypeptidase regulatory-like domain-containing protein [Deltaproteobacteria bacterium]